MRKRVLLGVTGGIAVYKSVTLVSLLVKAGIDVVVVMTDSACKFVTPLTFETISKNRVITDMFARDFPYEVEHISLAKSADVAVVAPATANFVGKVASGIADDMLTTTFMACKKQKLICPAMNTNMYEDSFFQANLSKLMESGIEVIEPASGMLACGDVGKGRMCEPEQIAEKIKEMLGVTCDYAGKKVLVTAGATCESIDGVRYLSNHSSGKMGVAIADNAISRGAEVLLVVGNTTCNIPSYINTVKVTDTQSMFDVVTAHAKEFDYVIKAAAPADYRPKKVYDNKVKEQSLILELEKTPDIAYAVGHDKGNCKLIIFSAETENLIENAKGKLKKKNADMVVANDVTQKGAGFNVDTNIVTIITNDEETSYEMMSKSALAEIILDKALTL
ncbi:MAG: bifunctional phosphopantothenoylcysteine decarboxylase/phosphopantothenate--cysteine ligase CoaBC [Clostridia bacterium]|nr:bifunctional phosphopantothenoylcysteine decarboxylase/phosphopantothenate--cysteine ligase CoaBC [Clostridia bacterium]